MADRDPQTPSAVGFLTVLAHEQLGFVGGYLVTNLVGRPLEFHCTAPVKTNRAHQILYGATLWPYLYGEQIGAALLAKSSLTPLLVCTDVAPALAVRDFVAPPVVLVSVAPEMPPMSETPATAKAEPIWRIDAAHAGGADLVHFEWGASRLATSRRHPSDERQALEQLAAIGSLDLAEPFGRIREAIEEAHRAARKIDA